MNQENHHESTSKKIKKFDLEFDEFQISEETFKPMTKGLGFHHETKKSAFKAAPREIKKDIRRDINSFATTNKSPLGSPTPLGASAASAAHIPSGLEAFYSTNANPQTQNTQFLEGSSSKNIRKELEQELKVAPMISQFGAWLIDVFVIMAFVILTATLLVFASGIELKMYSKIVSTNDLVIFAVSIFSIYYLLYFTILDLGATPGKTIFGLKLVRSNGKNVAVKHAFFRAFISLLSGVALFLPLLLDFHGRLTDTKVVE